VRGGPNGAPSAAYPANVPKTGQTTSYTAGDDGDLEWGVAWPTPRFTDNGNGTVTDNLTGLTWTRDMSTPGPAACTPGVRKEWQASLDHVKCLNTNSYLGYTDWHLPNVNEMRSLIDYERTAPALPVGHPFTNVVSAGFWTSTTQISSNNRGGWVVSTINGTTIEGGKHTTQVNWAWPVRHGPPQPQCSDGDGDGYGNPGHASCPNGAQTDCNDGNPNIFPGAAERCDGVDNDCDGTIDDGFNVGTSCSVGVGQCLRNGMRICNAAGDGTICNATPGTPVAEICNGLDDDCDGTADDGNPGGGGSCPTGIPGICALGTLTCTAASLQCAQTVFPTVELCNGLDDDCDGTSDEGASDASTWYADADSDTYGNPAASLLQCSQPAGYVSNSQDCDDANPAVGVCNSPVSPDPKTFDDPAGNASVTLPNVTAPGDTTITSAPCASPPIGIFTPPNPLCIDIETTASFSGDAEVCIHYDDSGLSPAQEQNLRMVRYPDAAGCAAEQKPFPCPEALPLSGPLGPPPAVDTVNNIICATTDRFSEFAVGVLTDVDGDFVQDLFDNCPLTVNFFQEDGDADGAGDVCDNCRVFANPTQADVNANGIGNACECGDQTGDGRVNVQDLVAINLAIFTPSLATPLCDTNNDGQCNVGDIVGANLKIFGRPAYCSRYPPPGP
jgi:hypothetical protein